MLLKFHSAGQLRKNILKGSVRRRKKGNMKKKMIEKCCPNTLESVN